MSNQEEHIHIINPMWNAYGGSEWRALSLYKELKAHCDVTLWTEYSPDPLLSERYPIKRIRLSKLQFPKAGTLIFVGVYSLPKLWVYLTRPQRVIVVYNTFASHLLLRVLHRLSFWGLRQVEVVFASELLKQSVDFPGKVEHSLIDIQKFAPPAQTKRSGDRFVIGRVSRDLAKKHHPRDPQLYRRMVEHGCEIRIMGGTCLAEELHMGNVTLLPAGSEESHVFLQGLDCFFYRTSDEWLEAFGRVILEAMACGLPVVCHKRGGYVSIIDNGRNGFLFETDEEAFEILLRLKNDLGLRQAVSKAARETVEDIYSPGSRLEVANYYLGRDGLPTHAAR